MKLFQYRFGLDDAAKSFSVGEELKHFFTSNAEKELVSIAIDNSARTKEVRTKIGSQEVLRRTASQSFVNSYSANVDHEVPWAIKSKTSCRFVVFLDNGLIRICYASDDEIIQFNSASPDVLDVSTLLIETDFFDFL